MQRIATKFLFNLSSKQFLPNLRVGKARFSQASFNYMSNQRRFFSNIDAAIPAHEVEQKSFAHDYD